MTKLPDAMVGVKGAGDRPRTRRPGGGGPRMSTGLRILASCVVLVACADGARRPDSAAAAARRPGIRFDPSSLQVGSKVGTVVVDTVFTQQTVFDSRVGM